MNQGGEQIPGSVPAGRLLSNRFDGVSREVSPAAVWVDRWVANPAEAVGSIFDLGNSFSHGSESTVINDLIFGHEPVIDVQDFNTACLEWLNSGQHLSHKYETLFNVLESRDNFLLPEVYSWYINNLEILKKVFSSPESDYNRFMEKITFLASGKNIREYEEWWMEQVRAARKERDREGSDRE